MKTSTKPRKHAATKGEGTKGKGTENAKSRRDNRCITPCKAQPQFGVTNEAAKLTTNVIGSAAKQSRNKKHIILDCFVAALLAMTRCGDAMTQCHFPFVIRTFRTFQFITYNS
jgi:hypothetical protein